MKRTITLESPMGDSELCFTFEWDNPFLIVTFDATSDGSQVTGQMLPSELDRLCTAWKQFKSRKDGE